MKKHKPKQEDAFRLTFKGLLTILLKNEELTTSVLDSVELFLRRNYAPGGKYPAIILTKDGFEFGSVVKK